MDAVYETQKSKLLWCKIEYDEQSIFVSSESRPTQEKAKKFRDWYQRQSGIAVLS